MKKRIYERNPFRNPNFIIHKCQLIDTEPIPLSIKEKLASKIFGVKIEEKVTYTIEIETSKELVMNDLIRINMELWVVTKTNKYITKLESYSDIKCLCNITAGCRAGNMFRE